MLDELLNTPASEGVDAALVDHFLVEKGLIQVLDTPSGLWYSTQESLTIESLLEHGRYYRLEFELLLLVRNSLSHDRGCVERLPSGLVE